MPKTNPPENTTAAASQAPAEKPRGPSAVSLLFFWPFHLFNLLTRRFGCVKRYLLRLAGYPVVAALYGLLFFMLIYGTRARRFDLERIHAMPERTIIRDRLNEEIGRIHGEKRSIVPLRQVAENFRKAILAREDERFYKHGAIDPIGIVRAAIKNAQGKREGASTITQQLVSDVFQLKRGEKRGDWPRQLDRKFLEIAIAIRLEASLEKDDILEAYINQINWGRQIKGVGEASRIYFEKHPSELTLSRIRAARRHRARAGFLQSLQVDGGRHPRAQHHARTHGQRQGHHPRRGGRRQARSHQGAPAGPPRRARIVRHGRHPPRSRNHSRRGGHRPRRSRNHHHHRPAHPTEGPRRRWRRNSARSSASRLFPSRRARHGSGCPEDAREEGTRNTSRARRSSSKTAPAAYSPWSADAMPRNPASTAPRTRNARSARCSSPSFISPPSTRACARIISSATARSSPARSRAAAPGVRAIRTANTAA